MAGDGLIEAYLRELHARVRSLPDADDIVDEARDHLLEVAERLVAEGLDRRDAEAEALARFGAAPQVARTFVRDAGKGATVPTTLTRRAGLAAVLAPVLAAVGQAGNEGIDRGAGHGVAVGLLLAAVAAFLFALWGLRARHGGLGRLGHVAFWLTVAAPFIALPFSWGAPVALVVVMGVVVVVLSVAMVRAGVLPVVPLVLLALGPIGAIAILIGVSAAGGDAGPYFGFPLLASVIAFVWLGWTMWREPAFDAPGRRGPLAVAP